MVFGAIAVTKSRTDFAVKPAVFIGANNLRSVQEDDAAFQHVKAVTGCDHEQPRLQHSFPVPAAKEEINKRLSPNIAVLADIRCLDPQTQRSPTAQIERMANLIHCRL